MGKGIVLLLAALYALNRLVCGDVRPPDGVLAPSPPLQQAVSEELHWTIADHQLTALASYEIEAHLIPADDTVRRASFAVRTGQVVTLRGWLVAAQGADGFRWRSSLTRNDTGGGSCELMLVEGVDAHEELSRGTGLSSPLESG